MTRLTANAGSLALLRSEAAGDVAEDVLHLVAEDDKDHDHDHGDEDQRVTSWRSFSRRR